MGDDALVTVIAFCGWQIVVSDISVLYVLLKHEVSRKSTERHVEKVNERKKGDRLRFGTNYIQRKVILVVV